MHEGDYLRHRARPEWGIGQVLERGEDRIDVQFRHDIVLLKFSVATAFLERVSKAEAIAAGEDMPPPRKVAARKPRASKKNAVASAVSPAVTP